jgi:F-type H+-transporting ATPase subunit b
MDRLGINLGYLIFFILNFLLLLILLKAWVYEPILGMLEKRKAAVAQGVDDARVAAEARASAEKEAAKILAEAQAEAGRRAADVVARAEQEAASLRAGVEEDRRKLLKAAEEDARLERERHLADLRGQIAAIAIAAANRIIGDTLDERRQHALIQDLFSGVKAGRVVVLEGETMSGESALVTSALPLTAEEQAQVKTDLVGRLGSAAAVTFKVDPSILGGLIIRVGDKLIDGSVAGKLENLRASLK